MGNKYAIKINECNQIIMRMYTFDINNECIILSEEEYKLAEKYKKFNPNTREFSEEIIEPNQDVLSDKKRIEQLEETIGILAEQLAKQSLGM